MGIVLLMVVGLGIVFFLGREVKRGTLAVQATFADCDASDRLMEWRLANPDVAIGTSPLGRALVLRCMETWREFLKMHPYVPDLGRMDLLSSLLLERDPPPPGKSAGIPQLQRLAHAGLSFFSMRIPFDGVICYDPFHAFRK